MQVRSHKYRVRCYSSYVSDDIKYLKYLKKIHFKCLVDSVSPVHQGHAIYHTERHKAEKVVFLRGGRKQRSPKSLSPSENTSQCLPRSSPY